MIEKSNVQILRQSISLCFSFDLSVAVMVELVIAETLRFKPRIGELISSTFSFLLSLYSSPTKKCAEFPMIVLIFCQGMSISLHLQSLAVKFGRGNFEYVKHISSFMENHPFFNPPNQPPTLDSKEGKKKINFLERD